MPLPLLEVFPDEDYRFHLTLRPSDPARFFQPADAAVLEQRRHWLRADPVRYVGTTPEAAAALPRLETAFQDWTLSPPPTGSTIERLIAWGGSVESDFVLLTPNSTGAFCFRAGVVCFPSSWALEEKLGHTLDEIHGPVPTLNADLGASIGRFLTRLKPGVAYERANWGLAATPELNLHPALDRPRLSATMEWPGVWVRIEDQILVSLSPSAHDNGPVVLFGIRLRILPGVEVVGDPELRQRVRRALATMPDDVAAYKGLAAVRGRLVAALG
jgi:hypothetical protein